MKLNLQDLEKIADLTLEHYNQRAEEFWEGILAKQLRYPGRQRVKPRSN